MSTIVGVPRTAAQRSSKEDEVAHGGLSRAADLVYDVGSRLLAFLVVLFLLAPVFVVFVVSFSDSGLEFWPRAFGWDGYRQIPAYMFHALFLSLRLAALAVAIALLLSVPLAVAMVRGGLPGRSVVEAFFRSPIQLPALVLGVALYQYFIFIGSSGGPSLRGTFSGLVIGHLIAITPYLLSTIIGRLSEMDPVIEEAATGLGAGFLRVLWKVTLPQMRSGIFAGSFLAFLVSFNDVALSVFLTSAGTAPLPVVMLSDAETMPAIYLYGISAVVVMLSIVVCVLVDRFVGLRAAVGAAR